MDDSNDPTLRADDLTKALRAWLRARPEPDMIQATALCYELTALIARNAHSVPQAHALLDRWLWEMKEQIATLGVGVEHP